MGKILGISNQVNNPENALPVTEISAEEYEKNKPASDPQPQDKKPTVVQFNTTQWTNHLGPCHAVCMYGEFKYNKEFTGLLLGHFACAKWNDLMERVNEMLQTMSGSYTTTGIYIIGGQPASEIKFNMVENLPNRSLFKCVLSPLTTDKGGRAAVIMHKERIQWCVYSEEQES
jgi:hypothetical protein